MRSDKTMVFPQIMMTSKETMLQSLSSTLGRNKYRGLAQWRWRNDETPKNKLILQDLFQVVQHLKWALTVYRLNWHEQIRNVGKKVKLKRLTHDFKFGDLTSLRCLRTHDDRHKFAYLATKCSSFARTPYTCVFNFCTFHSRSRSFHDAKWFVLQSCDDVSVTWREVNWKFDVTTNFQFFSAFSIRSHKFDPLIVRTLFASQTT